MPFHTIAEVQGRITELIDLCNSTYNNWGLTLIQLSDTTLATYQYGREVNRIVYCYS